MSTQTHFLKRGVLALAAVMLVLPFVARAGDFAWVDSSKPGKVTLTAQAVGFAPKGGSIDAPPLADITLNWTIPADWKGCYSNWQAAMIAVNDPKTITAKIPNTTKFSSGRTFILTCFGLGQAQTVAVKVNIVKPDIMVASFTGTAFPVPPVPAVPAVIANPKATPPIAGQPGRPAKPNKNTYYAGSPSTPTPPGPGGITFKAILRNIGRTSVPAAPAVATSYEWALLQPNKKPDKNTVWTQMNAANLETGSAIAPGATPTVTAYPHTAGVGGPFFFRAKADSVGATGVVDEAKEDNNTKIIGPYYFIAR